MRIPNIELRDGNKIPQIALGLWKIRDELEFNNAFKAAIKAGYRHFDSAQAYDNENYLGDACIKSDLKRNDLYLTTKIAVGNFGSNKLLKSFEQSIANLQTDYVDLLLLHFPVTILRKNAWKTLETIQKSGSAKSIGVSNFTIRHLEEMKDYAVEMPAVNQVELHLFLQQPELIEYCQGHNITVEAYSPLAHAKAMDDPLIIEIAKKHNKSYSQIMLRWCVQMGLVILPKSVNPIRIKENIDIFDFKLDDEDMRRLAILDRDLRTCWSPVHVP